MMMDKLESTFGNIESSIKRVLYEGLIKDIKQQAGYKHDTIKDYDRFKIKLRKIETDNKTKKCHATMNVDKKERSE